MKIFFNKVNILVLSCFLLCAVFLPTLVKSNSSNNAGSNTQVLRDRLFQYVPGDIIVKYKENKQPQAVDNLVSAKSQIGQVESLNATQGKIFKDFDSTSNVNINSNVSLDRVSIYKIPDLEQKSNNFIQKAEERYEEEKAITQFNILQRIVRKIKQYFGVSSQLAPNSEIKSFKVESPVFGEVEVVIKKSKTTVDPFTQELLDQLNNDPDVEYAEVNSYFYASNVTSPTNNPYYQFLWGFENEGQNYPIRSTQTAAGTPGADIDAIAGWAKDDSNGGEGIIVAVIDTGVDYTHEDLGACTLAQVNDSSTTTCPNFVPSRDFLNNDNDPMDDNGHGTHCAGTIAALNNSLGVIGIAPNVRVMALKGLGANNSGSTLALSQAVQWAASSGAHIINNSWGGPGKSQTLEDAFQYAYDLGAISLVAAGNDTRDALDESPASYNTVITIGASDSNDGLADFSNFGPKIDVVAPGLSILSLRATSTATSAEELEYVYEDNYIIFDGTSMATPLVAGVAAIIKANNPNYSLEQVRQVLRVSAKDLGAAGFDERFGYGRVNLNDSLNVNGDIPELIITSPDHKDIATNTISITAIASGTPAAIASWGLYYRQISSTTFTAINGSGCSGVSASSSINCFFDTNSLSGDYYIELRATNTSSQVFSDNKKIDIQNFSITSPANNLIYRLAGSLTISGIVNNNNFALEWATSGGTNWSRAGITTTTPSALRQNVEIGNWDISGLSSGYYDLRLVIWNTTYLVRQIYFDPNLRAGWPVYIASECDSGYVAPVVADVTGDINKEIIMFKTDCNTSPKIEIYNNNGTLLRTIELTGTVVFQIPIPVIADIDNDGVNEIIVSALDNRGTLGSNEFNDDVSRLYAYNSDGSLVTGGYPITLQTDTLTNLTVADLDKDGDLEIIAKGNGSYDTNGDDVAQRITIISNASISAQWNLPVMNIWADPIYSSVALGNFDNDTDLEIVVAISGRDSANTKNVVYIYVYNRNGDLISPWPVSLDGRIRVPVAIGDINNDGNDEIVTGLSYESNNANTALGGIYAYSRSGTVLSGWPILKGEKITSAPALADINNDNNLEISFTIEDNLSYLVNSDASTVSGWPQSILEPNIFSSAIADINQDGLLDIISVTGANIVSNDRVYAWSSTGTPLQNFPKILSPGISPGPTISDIDGNGRLELITSHMAEGLDGFFVWDLNTTYSTSSFAWPTFQHDAQLTGYYPVIKSPINLTADGATTTSPTKSSSTFSINWTNPDSFYSIVKYWYKLGSVPTSDNDGTSTTAKPFNINATQENGQMLYVWLEDNKGNVDYFNNASVNLMWIDNPPAPVNLTANGSNPSPGTTSSEFIINWTNPTYSNPITTYWYKLGSAPTTNTDGTSTTSRPFTINATQMGGQILYVWLQDDQGKVNFNSNASVQLNYTSSAPIVTLATSSQEYIALANYTNYNIQCNGIFDPNPNQILTMSYSLNNGTNWYPLESTATTSTTTSPKSNYNHSVNIDLENASPAVVGYANDGAKSIMCQVNDGTDSTASAPFSVFKDTLSPNASVSVVGVVLTSIPPILTNNFTILASSTDPLNNATSSGMSEDDSDYFLKYKTANLAGTCQAFSANWVDVPGITPAANATTYNFDTEYSTCYQFQYIVADKAGNTSATTSNILIFGTVPTTTPVTSAQTYITPTNYNDFNISCNGITDPDENETLTISYAFVSGTNWYPLESTATTSTTTSPKSNYNHSVNIDLEGASPAIDGYADDGLKTIVCRVYDGSFMSETSVPLNIIKDTTPPITNILYTNGYATTTNIIINIVNEDNAGGSPSSNMSSNDSDYILKYKTANLVGTCQTFSANWVDVPGITETASSTSYNFDTEPGTCYQFQYTVADKAGNIATSSTLNVLMSSNVPVAGTATSTQEYITPFNYKFFNLGCSGITDTDEDQTLSIFYSFNSGTNWYTLGSIQSPASSTTYRNNVNLEDAAPSIIGYENDGQKSIVCKVEDGGQLVGTSTSGFNILKDTTPPIPTVDYLNGYANATSTTVTVTANDTTGGSGASDDNTKYLLEFRDATLSNNGSCGAYSGWTFSTVDETATSTSYNFSLLPERCYQFKYTMEDKAGNEGSAVSTKVLKSGTAPFVSSISITGNTFTGSVLTGNYTYSDNENNPQGDSILRWLQVPSGSGPDQFLASTSFNTINSTSWTYTLTPSQVGRRIKFEVVPISQSFPFQGLASSTMTASVNGLVPVAQNISITGTTQNGQTLTGSYTYFDQENDPQGGTIMSWWRSGQANGTYTEIVSARTTYSNTTGTSSTYTLTSSDSYQYIRFQVTPISTFDPTTGSTTSFTTAKIEGMAPVASSVDITGNPRVGQVLTGSYVYSDSENDSQTTSNMKWFRSTGSNPGGPYGSSPVSETDYVARGNRTNSTYTVSSQDLYRYIKFEVTPRAAVDPFVGTIVSKEIFILGTVPVANNIRITGLAIEGETLTGRYDFSDNEGETQGTSTFRWLRSDSPYPSDPNSSSMSWIPIAGATNITYVVNTTYNEFYLKFEVTPITSSGNPDTGIATTSAPIGPVVEIDSNGKLDVSRFNEKVLSVSSTTPGTAAIFGDSTEINMDNDQSLNCGDAIVAANTSDTPTGTMRVDDALESVMGIDNFVGSVEKVNLRSGRPGEIIILSSVDNLRVEIPDNTTIYADAEWDCSILPPVNDPTQRVIGGYPIDGLMNVGSKNFALLFDKPVKITIPSTKGVPYYSVDSINWAKIDTQCSTINGGGFNFPGQCYFKDTPNNATIIWSYHFTSFGMGIESIDLKIYNNATSTIISGNDVNESELKIIREGEVNYIPLVPVDSTYDSGLRIYVNGEVKALKEYK